MPFLIEQNPPQRVVLRPARTGARWALAGGLIAIGIVAVAVAVGLTVAIARTVIEAVMRRQASVELGLLPAAWLVSILASGGGLLGGRFVLRGRRHVVLFLRRFRYSPARDVVTHAAATSLGASWRLVTLDDQETEPLGPSGSSLRWSNLATIATRLSRFVERVARAVPVVGGAVLLGILASVYAGSVNRPKQPDPFLTSLNDLARPVVDMIRAGHPTIQFGANLDTVVLVLLVILGATVAVAVILLAVGFLGLAVLTPLLILGQLVGGLRAADARSRFSAHDEKAVESAARQIENLGRSTFSPGMFVLSVADPVWRVAVERFARTSDAVIVDVSAPSPNVLWEIGTTRTLVGSRLVLIGELDQLEHLARWDRQTDPVYSMKTGPVGDGSGPAGRLRALAKAVDGQTVLAYTTDDAGRRSFARALRDRLETMTATSG